MKKSICALSAILISSTSMASINSKTFVDCFKKAANEIIAERKTTGKDVKRICKTFPQRDYDKLIGKFSEIKMGKLVYYSADAMKDAKLIMLYDYVKDEMTCYSPKIKNGGIIPGIINSPTYYRNLQLTEDIFSKMIGKKFWDTEHSTMSEFNFEYCK